MALKNSKNKINKTAIVILGGVVLLIVASIWLKESQEVFQTYHDTEGQFSAEIPIDWKVENVSSPTDQSTRLIKFGNTINGQLQQHGGVNVSIFLSSLEDQDNLSFEKAIKILDRPLYDYEIKGIMVGFLHGAAIINPLPKEWPGYMRSADIYINSDRTQVRKINLVYDQSQQRDIDHFLKTFSVPLEVQK